MILSSVSRNYCDTTPDRGCTYKCLYHDTLATNHPDPLGLVLFCPGMLLVSFLTCVNVPPPNHLSFAAATLCAADSDGVAISIPERA
jgi:hypothetical protein